MGVESVGATSIGMEEVQMEQLRAMVQNMMKDELSGQQLGDAQKIKDIIDGAQADPTRITQNLRSSIEGLSASDAGEAAAIRMALGDINSVTPETFLKLERMRVDAKQTIFAERFDDFVSVVRQRLERITNVVIELTKKPDMSQQDLMRIQYEVMQMSIVLDVASKVGDKGSQALQTLFRDK